MTDAKTLAERLDDLCTPEAAPDFDAILEDLPPEIVREMQDAIREYLRKNGDA